VPLRRLQCDSGWSELRIYNQVFTLSTLVVLLDDTKCDRLAIMGSEREEQLNHLLEAREA